MRRLLRNAVAPAASAALLAALACNGAAAPPTSGPPPQDEPILYTYRVVGSFPHDPGAFTQGLAFADGELYEGTGEHGRSSLRRVELETGRVLQKHDLKQRYFGEGITLLGDRIIQLTWKSNLGFVYDRSSFELLETFEYPTEGWGLTHDGRRLIMSDGTANLYFLDPETFLEVGRLEVRDGQAPVRLLNELEFVDGEIFANVLGRDRIARIAPASGRVLGWIDLTGLLALEERAGADVLNGIAHDPKGGRLFVTGKWWPRLFAIEVLPRRD
jgi:glutamine cyclotransferase